MTDSDINRADAKAPRRSWLRYLLGFFRVSLRSMLVLVAVASVCALIGGNYYREYALEQEMEASKTVDGWVYLNNPRDGVEEFYFGRGRPLQTGDVVLRDQYGRLRMRGAYDGFGNANGRWTSRFPSGRIAVTGRCQAGARTGVWRFNHPHGLLATVTYAPVSEPGADSGAMPSIARQSREGPARIFHLNGHLRAAGDYHNDVRRGDWVLYHENGTPAASGAYHNGRRHGPWLLTGDTRGSDAKTVFYSHGVQSLPPAELLAGATQALDAGDAPRAASFMQHLASLEVHAVPELIAAVDLPDSFISRIAIDALARSGKAARPAAAKLRNFTTHKEPATRAAAWMALWNAGLCDDKDASSALTAHLANTPSKIELNARRFLVLRERFATLVLAMLTAKEDTAGYLPAIAAKLFYAVSGSARMNASQPEPAAWKKVEAAIENHKDKRVQRIKAEFDAREPYRTHGGTI